MCRIRHAYAISKIWAWSEIPDEKRIVFWTKVAETTVFVNLILTKELLCIDDATLVKIKDYDNTEDEESDEDNTDYFSDIVNEEDLVVVY